MKTGIMQIDENMMLASVAGSRPSTEVSEHIKQAEKAFQQGAGVMTVAKTKSGIEVLSEFSMRVRKDVMQVIYSAPHGFHMPLAV